MEIHKLFSNRSACFYGLGDYTRALSDAENTIRHSPKVVACVRVYLSMHACMYVSGLYDMIARVWYAFNIRADANTFSFLQWSKGYNRKGAALAGMGDSSAAADAYRQVSLSLSLSLSLRSSPPSPECIAESCPQTPTSTSIRPP